MAIVSSSSAPRTFDTLKQQAATLLSVDRVNEAVSLLEEVSKSEDTPQLHALLGAAYYRQESYDKATDQLRHAVEQDPGNGELTAMLNLAAANSIGEVQKDVTENPTSRAQLLAPPVPGPLAPGPAQGPGPAPTSRYQHLTSLSGDVSRHLAHGLGAVVGGVAQGAVAIGMGALGKPERQEVWTTWSRENCIQGLMTLDAARTRLNRNNLFSTYPDGAFVGFQPHTLKAPPGAVYARTADGSWNNLKNAKEGAAGTRFTRLVPRNKTYGEEDTTILTPNPRTISRELQTRKDGDMIEIPFLNMLAASWIQFVIHDWISHGDNDFSKVYRVPLAPDDPMRQRFHMTDMIVPKTAADPTRQASERGQPATYINEVTPWFDGGQIYGNDEKTQLRLRTMQDGKMRVDAKGNLPVDKSGVEETGFRRNWWLGLSMLHNLFVLEHNSVCDMLKSHHPDWDDQRLFQTARLVVSAEMAKIHSVDWTPAILPNKVLNMGMNSNWYGNANLLMQKPGERTVLSAAKPTDEVLGGIIGNKTNNHGVAYNLAEEFTGVYRMHSLLPDVIRLLSLQNREGQATEVPLGATRNAAAHKISDKVGMADLFYSFGNQHPGALVLGNYPKTLQELAVPHFAGYDMAAVDIIRDRERGVPRYNEFRRLMGLNPIKGFEDLSDDKETVDKLKTVYNNDIEQIDLQIGAAAEAHRPEYFGFGETFFQVFLLTATWRLQSDRFFTTDYNAQTYTKEGLQWIDQNNMKSLVLRHYPQLATTGLANVDNAFEPWDEGPEAHDLTRHPLEAYKK